ncbi:VOC family protein [Dyadobacter chenhuakuii]|uniref:VOC family protein n=1 Tax=Dyadobacter chenhuakuii TaxID=2909339 RepID=A0ABY4XQ36_9BACT|nr:VOC family protein [Dyadobacter chenhuakuii]MCF2493198.1 VOC family protein [Dyadobacter chenhuakuii]USJ32518.1 VOC family protein [Dyadobacter chenhuakuii]
MATRISPYLTFNGNCKEAMHFYKDCFGGKLTLETIGDTPYAIEFPDDMQHQVMHAMLTTVEFTIMATDFMGGHVFVADNDISIALLFDDQQEIIRCFSKLAADGKVIYALNPEPTEVLFGVVQDQFDIIWMFNYNTNCYNSPC